MKKNLLFICYYYWPDLSIGAVRPTKVIKYLKSKYEITVLTHKRYGNKNDIYYGQYADRIIEIDTDESVASSQIKKLRKTGIYRKLKTKEWKKYDSSIKEEEANISGIVSSNITPRPSFGRKMSQQLVTLQQEYFNDKKYAGVAIKYIEKNPDEFRGFDAIISTFALMSSHIIADYIREYSTHAVWIADFRDPPILPTTPWIMRMYYDRWLMKIDRDANWITSVSQGSIDRIRVKHTYKKAVITNGFDPEDKDAINKDGLFINSNKLIIHDDSLNFLYAGNMYMEKGFLIPIFKATSLLVSQKKINRNRIHFYKIGNDYSIFARQAKACGIEDCVTNLGIVERKESIALQMSADLLMLASWNTDKEKGIISGKFFEYLLAERPIICCMKGNVPNSELKQWINGHDLGICYEEADDSDDFPKLCSFIEKMYNEKIDSGIIRFNTDRAFISQFTHDKIAAKFDHLIDISAGNS